MMSRVLRSSVESGVPPAVVGSGRVPHSRHCPPEPAAGHSGPARLAGRFAHGRGGGIGLYRSQLGIGQGAGDRRRVNMVQLPRVAVPVALGQAPRVVVGPMPRPGRRRGTVGMAADDARPQRGGRVERRRGRASPCSIRVAGRREPASRASWSWPSVRRTGRRIGRDLRPGRMRRRAASSPRAGRGLGGQAVVLGAPVRFPAAGESRRVPSAVVVSPGNRLFRIVFQSTLPGRQPVTQIVVLRRARPRHAASSLAR